MMGGCWRDSSDVLIEPNDLVAFNCSGDVVSGVVEYVPERSSTGKVKIRHSNLNGYVIGNAPVSRVRNGRSILVLKKNVYD
jgi:hypothetical protein